MKCLKSTAMLETLVNGEKMENQNLKRSLADYPELLKAYSEVKVASGIANLRCGFSNEEETKSLAKACEQLSEGKLNLELSSHLLPLSVQEVDAILNEALLKAAPTSLSSPYLRNQDSKEVFLTAFNLMVFELLTQLGASATRLSNALYQKAKDFGRINKSARIALQEIAVDTLEEQFSAYADGITRLSSQLQMEAEKWNISLIGCGPVGNPEAINTQFAFLASAELSHLLRRQLVLPADPMSFFSGPDEILMTHGLVQSLSMKAWRIVRDLRLMCSGPRCGFGLVIMPPVAPGSSIMPGKVNPVIAEMMMTTCDRVDANHTSITYALKSGWFEGGTQSTVYAIKFLESCTLLSRSMDVLVQKCISGLRALPDRCAQEV